MRNHSFFRLVKLAFCSAFFVSAASQAAGGTIYFRGAIAEPTCSVSAAQAGFDRNAINLAAKAQDASKVAGAPMQLKMNCNANQTMQLSFDDKPTAKRAGSGFGTGLEGVEIVLSRAGKDLRPGQPIAVAVSGKQERNIDIATALRHALGTAGNANGGKLDGAILVSMNYQ
ncbi:hypothetical protein [Herbaspirillum sp.]|uniref:fimbrial protein n=1 Tax=Herbaspirillum sp. TaxID=1890675 RepID=UPI001B16E398|nr:hypothetical protein [Herbaspirillum sp.]MBO9538277.1 hypothetical protein [Herbaspirillum sp.]